MIQLRIQDGKIVGHLGAFPLPMRIDGSSEIVLCGTDLMVDTGFGFVALQLMKCFVKEVPVIGSGLGPEARACRCFSVRRSADDPVRTGPGEAFERR